MKQQLANTGISAFSNIPTDKIAGRITIFQSEDLYKARHAFKLFNAAALALPFVVVACFGGAILLSRNRRRGFIAAAVAFTLGAVIMAVSLATGRGIYLHDLRAGRDPLYVEEPADLELVGRVSALIHRMDGRGGVSLTAH